MNFVEKFIIVNLNFIVPLLIMAILMFCFRENKHFFSFFYLGVFACFINCFINIFVMHIIRVNIYKNYNSGFVNLIIIYDFVLRFHIFAFFNIILKILIFKFILKNKDIDDFKKALYFSIGSSFLVNPLCRILSVGSWFSGGIKVLKSELFLLSINSLFLFVFEFCFSFFCLCIIKKKIMVFSYFLDFLLMFVYGFIFFLLRLPDVGMPDKFLKKYDVAYALYNLKIEDEIILGIFLIFILAITFIILVLKKFLINRKV